MKDPSLVFRFHSSLSFNTIWVLVACLVFIHFNVSSVAQENDYDVGVITQDRGNQGRLVRKYTYNGRLIIDATYEGDLATFARVPFRIDREARSREELHTGLCLV